MKSLSTLLRALQKSSYLESSTNAQNSVINFNLLNNGERFKTQLIENWRKTKNTRIPNEYYVENELYTYDTGRTSFINSDEFRDNIKHIRTNTLTRCPAIIKSKRTISINSTNVEKTNADILLVSNSIGSTQIIFDYFFNCETGLENFYNIERERKIWWMRNSANPSRYFLESYDLNSTSNSLDGITKSQSTTVKTRFSFGNASLETITLVPLSEVQLKPANDFYFKSQHAGHKILPAVIRSVINVETATAVLLLDGCDNERINTLLLNRKLVPYQCIIACLHNVGIANDLHDLCRHLRHVLERVGLRLSDNVIFTNSIENFNNEIRNADSLGIPYAILINENSLNTGLLKIRSRDTTLNETIHISEIAQYLLQIVRS